MILQIGKINRKNEEIIVLKIEKNLSIKNAKMNQNQNQNLEIKNKIKGNWTDHGQKMAITLKRKLKNNQNQNK